MLCSLCSTGAILSEKCPVSMQYYAFNDFGVPNVWFLLRKFLVSDFVTLKMDQRGGAISRGFVIVHFSKQMS